MDRDVETLRRTRFDVLVVGGGIYGVSVARDAALRGLRVGLIERGDFGASTSHNSLKLIHGGIRYIQHGDLARLRASAREQRFWLDAAPQLIRPLEFVIPLVGHGLRGPEAFALAAAAYDLTTIDLRHRRLRPAGVIGRQRCEAALAGLAPAGLTGGGVWHDAQMIDANRVLLACLQAAVAAGAQVANYVRAVDLIGPPDRIEGVVAEDHQGGADLTIRARLTINCAGPAAATLVARAGHALSATSFGGLARAMNLVVDRRVTPDRSIGVASRRRSDSLVDRGGRLFFLTPWGGRTVIGTAHLPHRGEPDDYRFSDEEIDAFLEEIDEACPTLGLGRDDVIYCLAGLTPADLDDDALEVRRHKRGNLIDHLAVDGVDGLFSIVGVKYTTARLIAQRVVDRALHRLGQAAVPCRSATTPLPVLGPVVEPLDGGALVTRCHDAVRDEMALHLADLVFRRSRLAETGAIGPTTLTAAADAMATVLGWDRRRTDAELEAVRLELARHRRPAPAAPAARAS